MKAIYKFLFLGVLLVMTAACDLTEEPYGFYSPGNLYKTPQDAEAAIIYTYDALTYIEYSRAIYYLGDLPTDELKTKSDESADNLALKNWDVSEFPKNNTLTNYFKYSYIAINRANAILANLPKADFSQSMKNKYLGEAYFLRAWCYFGLARNFGLVPIHRSVVSTLKQTTASLAPNLDEEYDFILSDCRKAIKLLKIDQVEGRADKAAAQSLAAKVYLTIASSKQHGVPLYSDMKRQVSQMYDSAAVFARDVVEKQSVYGFEDNLLSIYNVNDPTGKENIFLLSMDRSGQQEGEYSKIDQLFLPYISGATDYLRNPDGSFSPTHEGFSELQTTASFYNSFSPSDKRKTILMVDTVYDADGNVTATYPGSIPYPFTRKYIDPDFIGGKTSVKPFLIRFSDIALVLAEAVGPTAEGYKQVNYIRNRAGLGDLPPGLTVGQFRQDVLRERKWELDFEANRLYDLRRFNIVQDMVPQAAGLTDKQADFYPIPQTEIDLNQGLNLTK